MYLITLYLGGFGLGFIECVDEFHVVQHVACGRSKLSEQGILQVFEETLVLTRLQDQTLPLFLEFFPLKAHNDAQQLVLQTF